jgi:hypothetical protein
LLVPLEWKELGHVAAHAIAVDRQVQRQDQAEQDVQHASEHARGDTHQPRRLCDADDPAEQVL